ncbi:N-acetyl-gamma-glutamyl-phosphate reductase [Nonomuraea insulae]|uniref:N-acetyl-gamma-glutamyl-phosphate reductase n=1 Tax=Nonomuraea insulae TaxID=1616787 RepID=A0ABW1CSZ0_9ACTN
MNRSPSAGLTVGVVGAAGHAGGELCRLLLGHPAVTEIVPVSRGGQCFARAHPNLLGSGLEFVRQERLAERAAELDAVFFCAPAGEAMRSARHYTDLGVPVIDLGADFRFADPAEYRRVYGEEHSDSKLLTEAVYGVTELNRDRLRHARLVANPGCYAITAILGLAPLLAGGHLAPDGLVSIHAVNGTTGAGSSPKQAVMHAEMTGSMLSYNLEGHRHGPELEAYFTALAGVPVPVDLNTAHGPFARGIHLQASLRLRGTWDRDELLRTYVAFYGAGHDKEPFVLVNDLPKQGARNDKDYDVYPAPGSVTGSNYCHIGLDHDADRSIAKVVAVTDNLVKGAAGSAIQNMNVMLGMEETWGLRHYAL